MNEKILELAKEKYGLSNFVATHENFESLQKYADNYTGSEKTIAHLFIMMTYNTTAFLKAKEELEK
jgi:hypothetical protein